ncbi:septum site-determining protein MinC [Acetobacter conturbans]|uniref:septum site-determining protein MinC n=1 Tax=Acetobacter conturbans TaxID=1737472 RepID=UPI0030D0CC22
MTSSTASTDPAGLPRIRAGGRSFLALVLTPEAPLDIWLAALDHQVSRSAGFFAGKPIILDLTLVPLDTPHLADLLPALVERGIRVIGIEGADRDEPVFSTWEWPEGLNGGRSTAAEEIPVDSVDEPELPPGTLIIEEPVRSGQQIVWADGDVIVLGSVASGAEVSAGGSIHVYGSLRGRAIAGIVGRPEARIFARVMEPELLAIDGFYAISEEMPEALIGKSSQAILVDEVLTLKPLT